MAPANVSTACPRAKRALGARSSSALPARRRQATTISQAQLTAPAKRAVQTKRAKRTTRTYENKIYAIAFIAVCFIVLACVSTHLPINERETLFITCPFFIGSFFLGYCTHWSPPTLSCVSGIFLTVGIIFPRYITGAWPKNVDLSIFVIMHAFTLGVFLSIVVVFSGRWLRKLLARRPK